MLRRKGYRIKIMNTINFKKSHHYNPFSYIHSEKDILKLVNCLIVNTKGEGGKSGDDFWLKAEMLLYTALIGYIHYEAPEEEQNFSTLLEFINASEAREDDENFKNAVDELFEELEKDKPEHFAVRQYKKYKLAAGKTAKSILISCGARLAPFYNHTGTGYNLDYIDMIGVNNLAWSDSNLAAIASDRSINTLMSGMLRVNYVFMNRYMLTASIRADGSSRLKDKWSYFPSAALAWDLKQENFLKENSFIDQLKLRLGYGSVGNQAVEAYRIYSKMTPVTVTTPNGSSSTAYKIDRPAAPFLKWERNDQFNVGVDFGILNGRVRLTADWYSKLSKDILLEVARPSHMGYTAILDNAGEIKNTGVEFTISADPFSDKEFSWHTDLTLSHNKGTFNKIPTANHRQQQAGNFQNQIFQMIEGEKLGSFWGYTFAGVWQEDDVNAPFVDANGQTNGKTNGEVYKVKPGNSKYVDVNKDGVYNDADQGIIGCGQPTFNWGWNNTFNYKNFDFSFFVVGFHGFDIYNATHQMGYNLIKSQQMAGVTPMRELLNRWTPTNTNTDIPGFVKGGTENKDFFSTRFVENGSFIKMKSITLGYTLPEATCRSLGINNLRVYASVQNPFHITKYSGLDPEATMGSPLVQGVDWGAYPNSRNYLIGLNFSF